MTSEVKAALLGGIVGSLLAFILARLTSFLDRIARRNKVNIDAIVELQHLVDANGSIINDNIQSLNSIVATSQKEKALCLNRFSPVTINEQIKIKLLDIELINKVNSLEYTYRRINADTQAINENLDSFQSAVLSGSLDGENYKSLVASLVGDAEFLKVMLEQFLDDSVEMMAYTQIRHEKDLTPIMKIAQKIIQFRKRAVADEELAHRIQIVRQDIEDNRKKSNELLSNVAQIVAEKEKK